MIDVATAAFGCPKVTFRVLTTGYWQGFYGLELKTDHRNPGERAG